MVAVANELSVVSGDRGILDLDHVIAGPADRDDIVAGEFMRDIAGVRSVDVQRGHRERLKRPPMKSNVPRMYSAERRGVMSFARTSGGDRLYEQKGKSNKSYFPQ